MTDAIGGLKLRCGPGETAGRGNELTAGVLTVANLLAAVPALLAARSHPARLLRAG